MLQGDYSTCQLLEAVLLAVSVLLHISQDLAGITNFLVEVLQQLLGHFCTLAWEEGGVDKAELVRRSKQLGSLVVRSWQP